MIVVRRPRYFAPTSYDPFLSLLGYPHRRHLFLYPHKSATAACTSSCEEKTTSKETNKLSEEPKQALSSPSKPSYRIGRAWVTPTDEAHVLSLDVPGVQPQDVFIQEHDGKLSIQVKRHGSIHHSSIKQTLVLDQDSMQLDAIDASLEDGVLTISIPNQAENDKEKSQEPFTVPVISSDAPVHDDEPKQASQWTYDLPGVKAADVQIQVHRGTLVVVRAERHRGGDYVEKMNRMISLDQKRIHVAAMQAYLHHGVLTIVAPHKPIPEPRHIPVTVLPEPSQPALEEQVEPPVIQEDRSADEKEESLQVADDDSFIQKEELQVQDDGSTSESDDDLVVVEDVFDEE